MKQTFKLTCLSLMLMVIALNSCHKRETELIPQQQMKSALSEAQAYYDAVTTGKSTPKITNGKSNVLTPNWKENFQFKGDNGIGYVVVPAEGFKLQKSMLSVQRLFIFEMVNNRILSGRLIEVYGDEKYISSNRNKIISKYEQKNVPGFTGYVATYDLNYKYAKGASFMLGKQTDVGKVAQSHNGQDLTVLANNLNSKNRVASSNVVMNEPDRNCQDWYWVVKDGDGDIVSITYMYTICDTVGSGGGGGGDGGHTGGGGGNGDGDGEINPEDPGELLYRLVTNQDSIKLAKRMECFDALPNEGATYTVKICADIPRNNLPDALLSAGFEPGHAFLTLTKKVNGVSVTENIGFYPKQNLVSATNLPVKSMMVDNEAHEFDAAMTITVPQATFENMLSTAILESKKSYDLNDNNCTDFALKVFNTGLGANEKLLVSDTVGQFGFNYGTTPNGLYKELKNRRDNQNDSRASIGPNNAPNSTKCP